MPRVLLFAAVALLFTACARRSIVLDDIRRIETEKKFVWRDSAQDPSIEHGAVVVEGERLQQVLRGAQCKEGNAEWKGGVPATLTFAVGNPLRADGFSRHGRLLKMHPSQWCELTEDGWNALWRQESQPPAAQ